MLEFLFSPSKSISKSKLDKMLRGISALSPQEREYVKAVFGKFSSNGISRLEAERVIRGMRFNLSDSLDPTEVQRIRDKILGFFK